MNFGIMSLDIIILLAVFAILLFWSFRRGKKAIVALIITTYPALLIYSYLPYIVLDKPMAQAVGFVVIYIITLIVLWHNVHVKHVHRFLRKITDYSLLTISYMALIISVSANSIPALQKIYTFSGFFPELISRIDYGIILVIPIILVSLTNKTDYN